MIVIASCQVTHLVQVFVLLPVSSAILQVLYLWDEFSWGGDDHLFVSGILHGHHGRVATEIRSLARKAISFFVIGHGAGVTLVEDVRVLFHNGQSGVHSVVV